VSEGPQQRSEDADTVAALLRVVHEVAVETRTIPTDPVVRLDSDFASDLGLDSLALAELLVRVEQRFEVVLEDEILANVETPRDLLVELSAAAALPGRIARPHARPAHAVVAPEPDAPADASSLIEVFEWHAARHPDRAHVRLIADAHDDEVLTYGALRREAAGVAAGLRERQLSPGASVAIMLPTGREYFVAFFGVLLAGGVPTPIYPPGRPSRLEEHLHRQVGILENARAAVLITVPEARRLARLVAPQVATLRHVVSVDDLSSGGSGPMVAAPHPSATALLQYTSGSTGEPKGVVLSHANLLANIRAMGQAGEIVPTDVFVSWLPLYHDMGLIGSWLLSLTFGLPFVVLSPLAFLARPVRWLQAIHDHGGTVSGGPNFGYELCVRRIEDAELAGLDLGSWRLAFNGAEPVSPDTVTRFGERFAHVGLQRGVMTPVYGLAESSVALTVPPLGRGPMIDRVAREPLARSGRALPATDDDPNPARFVACGHPLTDHQVRIADRAGATLPERHEGRVEFRGPSATAGYHRNPAATRRLFDDGWLDSGDLGYLADGQLHLTGRVKDLIIRAGRNLHPSELEEAVGRIAGVRKGCVAVFPVTEERTGTERLVVLAETRVSDDDERERIRGAVARVAIEVTGVPPDEVTLAPPGSVPKTSSGKIRRSTARERYERGQLADPSRTVWWQIARVATSSVRAAVRRTGARILGTLFGVYVRLVFALVALVVWPLVVVLPGVHRRWRVVKGAGRLVFHLAGTRISVTGAEHLPTGRAVVAANHASHLDPLVLALLLPEPVVFVGVGGLAAKPLIRTFAARLGVHLVVRGDRVRGLADSRALTALVRSGRTVVFFPEGRRSTAPGLEPFHMGAFVSAAAAGAPVVPIALRGTRHILPVGRRLPRHGPITVTVGPALSTVATDWAGAIELHHATRAMILSHCGEPDLS
jgi:1-acyl-sn-glycerol-3-phosphate acyltransferase